VEKALAWLASPELDPPPDDLLQLNQMEWFLLQKMLDSLLLEKELSPMQ
jgi:hypothetical protein